MDADRQKEISDALLAVSARLNEIEERLSQLGAGLTALKGIVSAHMNPANPKLVLERIEGLEETFRKLDPNAAKRKQLSEALEIVKMIEKHGGPKEA